MKYLYTLLIILTAAFCFLPQTANAGSSRVVSLVTLGNYAPFCYAKPGAVNRGREVIAPGADSDYLQGSVWEKVKKAFHSQGYTIILQVLPWSQAEAAARMGGTDVDLNKTKKPKSYYDMSFNVAKVSLYDSSSKRNDVPKPHRSDLLFPALKTEDRTKMFSFSNSPVNEVRMAIYVTKSSGLNLSGKDSLKGKKIGVMRGWNYGKLFNSLDKYVPIEFDSIESGFRSLRLGKITAFAGFTDIFDQELKRIRWSKFFKSYKAKQDIPEYLCGLKKLQRTRTLLEVYDLTTRNKKR